MSTRIADIERRSEGCLAHDNFLRSDVAYLLAELRKSREALARVAEVLDNWQAEVPFPDAEETQRWYSLGKRHAAERIRAEIKGDGV